MVVIFHFIANSEGKNHITSKNNFVYFLKGWGGSLFGWDLKFWKKAVGANLLGHCDGHDYSVLSPQFLDCSNTVVYF